MVAGGLVPGTTVGDFVVVRLLWDGPLSSVYESRGPEGARAALKLAKLGVAQDPTLAARFEREGTIAQRVAHHALVPVVATGIHDGHPWLAQPFVEGGSLAEHLAARGRLAVAEVAEIVTGIADGLDALHAAGIVHRDLNPSNVLLDGGRRPMITDFGLVKDLQNQRLTIAGSVLGTSDYIAPEQIRGTEVGLAADVYSLGCVTFEMLTGDPPFGDRDGMMVIWAHLSDAPDSVSSRRRDLPAQVDDVVARALRKDPADRPLSAGSFARALAQACAVRPAPRR